MILILIGTSGSGKSTIARRLMDSYAFREPKFVEKRKRPLYYSLAHGTKGPKSLVVLGHYESPCGGADTIKTATELFDLAALHDSDGTNVFMEGVLLYSYAVRIKALKDSGHEVVVFGLNEPLEECARSVLARRAEKGNTEEVGGNFHKNLAAKHKGAMACLYRLDGLGVPTVTGSRAKVEEELRRRLGL